MFFSELKEVKDEDEGIPLIDKIIDLQMDIDDEYENLCSIFIEKEIDDYLSTIKKFMKRLSLLKNYTEQYIAENQNK